MKKLSRDLRDCYLCGEPLSGDRTIEHIVPKGLFEKKGNLITLPAHRTCNNALAQDDEYFRLCITLAASSKDSSAKNIFDGPVMRGYHRPDRPGLKQSTLRALLPVEIRTPAGLIIGKQNAMFQDATRIRRIASRIARGLYSYVTGKVLPADWPVTSDLIDHNVAGQLFTLLNCRLKPIGNGEFHYDWKRLESDDRQSFFWMVFYRQVHFWGYIGDDLKAILTRMPGVEGAGEEG